ncbi:MAG TPA: hypothetical protein VKU19_35275 [Bryobacteraceae bacterium]|nr:hypothetical protein [Bryobacteraceae bacterium]
MVPLLRFLAEQGRATPLTLMQKEFGKLETYELNRLIKVLNQYNRPQNELRIPLRLRVDRGIHAMYVAVFDDWPIPDTNAARQEPTQGKLSVHDLVRVERPASEKGGHLTELSEVFIVDHQPLLHPEMANRVVSNIAKGCTYWYFFPLHSDKSIAQLLQRLVAQTTDQTLAAMEHRLSIIVTENPWRFRFSIHNAQDSAAAVCYLRPPSSDYVVEWSRGELAYELSQTVRAQFRPTQARRIWIRGGNIKMTEIQQRDLRAAVEEECRARSADEELIRRVMELSFGPEVDHSPKRQPRGR